MTILIKGMEMPETCAKCPICASMPLGDYAVYHKCVLLNRLASKHNRRYDCPLIEVPTPHGRLIDADALLSVAEPIEDRRGNVKRVVWDAHINRRPTVIEAEG